MADGSSPQARGARRLGPPVRLLRRLIPAGAGSTVSSCTSTRGCTAHPRRRGEHCTGSQRPTLEHGSSPQARGALRAAHVQAEVHGLIPAGAGSTRISVVGRRSTTAHPRRRGEHRFSCENQVSSRGSSPQARGAPWVARRRSSPAWLIPAGAGSTPRHRGP